MMTLLTILAVAAIVFAAWATVATLAWALIHGAEKIERTHYRSDGPVVINPNRRELIHVRGVK